MFGRFSDGRRRFLLCSCPPAAFGVELCVGKTSSTTLDGVCDVRRRVRSKECSYVYVCHIELRADTARC